MIRDATVRQDGRLDQPDSPLRLRHLLRCLETFTNLRITFTYVEESNVGVALPGLVSMGRLSGAFSFFCPATPPLKDGCRLLLTVIAAVAMLSVLLVKCTRRRHVFKDISKEAVEGSLRRSWRSRPADSVRNAVYG